MKYSIHLSVLSVIVMISSIIIPVTPIIYADLNSTPHSSYLGCNEVEFSTDTSKFELMQSQLPLGTTLKNNKGLYFNYKLWHDKRIVVYGNHKSIPNNHFVLGSQNLSGVYDKNAGYYWGNEKGVTGAGEYRYHGQDKIGNNYTNINFKNDFPTTIGLSDKKWMFTPWYNNGVTKDRPTISIFNQRAAQGNTKVQEWIGKTAESFSIGQAFDIIGNDLASSKFSERWNFIHVLTPPSATHPGEGRMWHNTNNQGLRYQTFSIEPVKKQPTDVNLKLELLTPQSSLNVMDTNDAAAANAIVPVKVRVTATLLDDSFVNDEVERVNRYTRYDINKWTIAIGGTTLSGVSTSANTATKECTINYTISQIRSRNFMDTIVATAYTTYHDSKNSATANASLPISFTKTPAPPPAKPVPMPPPPKMVELMPNIPDRWYDIIEFPASDGTDLKDVIKRQVFINDSPIDADQFFHGGYVFGEPRIGLNHVRMVWTLSDNQDLEATRYTVIYPTKPNAEHRLTGSYMQNRKMTVSDNSANSNLEFVISRFPITDYQWTFRELTGETGNLKRKDISSTVKDFLCKKSGTYEIELVVTNSLGRRSEPYVVAFTILQDYPAAVICNLNNSVLARNENISTYAYEAVSTDGDTIASNVVELWYDSDNNGTYDQLLQTWNNITYFPTYTPTKLGKYKFVNKVTEEFGHPTIPEFVTAEDRKSISVEREFWVDNYLPLTGLYVDIPIVRPEVDVFFMLDQNLKKPSLDWIIDNRMTINNTLRLSNIIARIDNWDLKTYTYSQPASTYVNTGSSYPSSTTPYTSNGYSGSLNRINVSDNGSYYDFGWYSTETESQYFSDSWINVGTIYYDDKGVQTGSASWSNPAPSSVDISSGGFSGSIPRLSTSGTEWYPTSYHSNGVPSCKESIWTAYYGGTLTRQVQVWVPNMQWVSNYTGYYEGTIYKDVKQPYTAPFVATHKKYVVYVSDGSIANLADLNTVKNNNSVGVILIGNTTAQSQAEHQYFVLNDGSNIEILVDKVLRWIAEQNPIPTEDLLITQNTVFNLSEADFDQEGDPLVNKFYQYVHDKDYYNNLTGQESGTQAEYSDITGWTASKKDRFANVGLFTIYRRVEDRPTNDPNFAEYNKASNIPALKVAVHRIPIALADMTWRYNINTSLYELTFIDRSYDLDHQHSRADKGIINTQIRYRKDAGEWNYCMPTNLSWGSYTIEYFVQDIEQAWSHPYLMNVNLSQVPPANIIIESTVIQKDPRMRKDSAIPASEVALLTSPDRTGGPIIRSNVPISSAEVLIDGAKTGDLILAQLPSQTEYVYRSSIYEYAIPADTADGSLCLTIRARASIGSQITEKDHSILIYTPIWENYAASRLSYITQAVSGIPPKMELSMSAAHDKRNKYTVVTSKYTSYIEISLDKIKYYIFKNGTAGISANGSGAVPVLTVDNSTNKFKVANITVSTSADTREWSFELSAVNNYPLKLNQPYLMSITGYDEAGNAYTAADKHGYNPQVATIVPNNYLLYSFRVVQIKDFQLESFYKNPAAGIGKPAYIDRPMYVNSMAVDASSFDGRIDGLAKGYKFEFEIDSKNFNGAADTIIIEPSFYTADAFGRDSSERDLYWEDSRHQIYKAGEGAHSAWKTIRLTSAHRTIKAGDEATWRGEYLIPGTAWAVPKGTTKAEAKSRDLKRDIIVHFNIKGYKDGILQFDYNAEQWGQERTLNKYPYLIGDVIKYSWNKNCLEDIRTKDNR